MSFQAMLRKTPHQRASMKRNPIYESVVPSESVLRPYRRSNEVTESNAAYKSRRSSPEWSPNEMILVSEEHARRSAWSEEESVTTEIAPGIVVKGYVADL